MSPTESRERAQQTPESPRSERQLADDAQQRRESAPLRWKVFSLVCTLLLATGSHYAAHVFSSLKGSLKSELHISNAQYGVLQAAVPLVSTVIPIIGGRMVDVAGVSISSLLFSVLVTVGEGLVAMAVSLESFPLMVIGRVIYGLGSSTLVALQHTIIAHWFRGSGLAVAVGLVMATARLSSYLSMFTVVPIRDATGWYGYPIWLSVGLCVISLLVNAAYIIGMRSFHRQSSTEDIVSEDELKKLRMKNKFEIQDVYQFKGTFWTVAWLSFVIGGVWTCFVHIAPEMVKLRFHQHEKEAAFSASFSQIVPIFAAPFCGFMIDRHGKHSHINLISTLSLLASLMLLWLTKLNPINGLLLFSISLAFGPVALVSSVSLLVRPESIGTAQGIYKALANVSSTILEPIVGLLQDTKGGYTAPLTLLTAFTCVGVLLSFLLMYVDAWYAKNVLSANDHDRRMIINQQNEEDRAIEESERSGVDEEESAEHTRLLRGLQDHSRDTTPMHTPRQRALPNNGILGKIMLVLITLLTVVGWMVYGVLFNRANV